MQIEREIDVFHSRLEIREIFTFGRLSSCVWFELEGKLIYK